MTSNKLNKIVSLIIIVFLSILFFYYLYRTILYKISFIFFLSTLSGIVIVFFLFHSGVLDSYNMISISSILVFIPLFVYWKHNSVNVKITLIIRLNSYYLIVCIIFIFIFVFINLFKIKFINKRKFIKIN